MKTKLLIIIAAAIFILGIGGSLLVLLLPKKQAVQIKHRNFPTKRAAIEYVEDYNQQECDKLSQGEDHPWQDMKSTAVSL